MPAFYPLHERDGKRPRVTVGVVSADLRSDHTAKCIDLVKAHSRDYDLVIVDNNRCGEFNHSREMNRLLEFCRTEFLVLMDDDVFVQEGWFPEKAPIRIETPSTNDNRSYHVSSRKIFERLRYRPLRTIQDAVRDLCHGFRADKFKDSMTNDDYVNVKTVKKLSLQ